MSTVLTAPPVVSRAREALFGTPGHEPTLDAVVSRGWRRLAIRGEAACPACGGRIVAVYGAAATPVEGRCADCGASLS